jgi:hypothetical protein
MSNKELLKRAYDALSRVPNMAFDVDSFEGRRLMADFVNAITAPDSFTAADVQTAFVQQPQDVTLTNEGGIPKIGCVNHDCDQCKETAKNKHDPVYKVSKAFLQEVCKIMDEIEGTGHYQMDVHDYAVMTLKDEPVVWDSRTTEPAPGVTLMNEGDIAELEHENRLLRARNERLQATLDSIVPRLASACGASAMPPVMIAKHIEEFGAASPKLKSQ